MKEFDVVIPREDGGIELHPLKVWLRKHPDYIPAGLDIESAARQEVRNALLKVGWLVQETQADERLFMPPGAKPQESIIDEALGDEEGSDDIESYLTAYSLEDQLRDFLAQNISAIPIEGKRLRLYVGPAGKDGIEYPTDVGKIDILAMDDDEQFVIFELSLARSVDHAISRLSCNMGWVSQTIGRDKTVRGVIVARQISDNLRYSVTVVPNVSLFEYEVRFELKPASPAFQRTMTA
jgi:hypothetical protein